MSECAGAECGHVSCTKVERARQKAAQRSAYPRTERDQTDDPGGYVRAVERMLNDAQEAATAHLFHKRYLSDASFSMSPEATCAPVLGVHRPWCKCEGSTRLTS